MTNLIHIKMNIKEIAHKSLDFTINRAFELVGATLILFSIQDSIAFWIAINSALLFVFFGYSIVGFNLADFL